MRSTNNSSQDENYEGLPYHEKVVHRWQFTVPRNISKKKWRPEDDPEWVRIGPGKWKRIPKETRETRRTGAED